VLMGTLIAEPSESAVNVRYAEPPQLVRNWGKGNLRSSQNPRERASPQHPRLKVRAAYAYVLIMTAAGVLLPRMAARAAPSENVAAGAFHRKINHSVRFVDRKQVESRWNWRRARLTSRTERNRKSQERSSYLAANELVLTCLDH